MKSAAEKKALHERKRMFHRKGKKIHARDEAIHQERLRQQRIKDQVAANIKKAEGGQDAK